MRRVIIVSNRLPVTVRAEQGEHKVVPSSGGLATALRGPHARTKGLWFGWPGDVSRMSADDRASIETQLAQMNTVPVHLTASEVAHYYDGFSNGVLWPLLHYLLDKVRLDADRDWAIYENVNRRFAERVAAHWRPGDMIWVHDYQLALVPAMLRELLPEASIGFFLHVPFPSPDVFRILPWDAEILRGILGADVVGFHTATYRRNFLQTAAQVLGVRPDAGVVQVNGRCVRASVHPIGIDAAEIGRASAAAEVADEVQRLRRGAQGKRIFLGVDRLDYTKGIPRRLLAFERFLERNPALRDKVLFVQLSVPSREKVDAYAQLRREVNELVGRINSQYGTATGGPIQLLYRSVPLSQLVALYRAADVMLVTPLRDGMNLVAKEYVASHDDRRGVLVLSEFAGAAAELTDAVLVNPYDLLAMARSMKDALEMTPAEQERRMRRMRARVEAQDVHAWVARFLEDLERSASGAPALEAYDPSPESFDEGTEAPGVLA
jgi:trehalose 6-phosphate synthase/phosphatase